MLFKKLSANYYQMTDSKGNSRRISKSRYLKETASKKVSRKNRKTYSRQVLQQLGGVGNINFKDVKSLVFVASPINIKERFSSFGGWRLSDKYTRQALESVLANYNFGSLSTGREVGFCFVDCDGKSHTKIVNAQDGDYTKSGFDDYRQYENIMDPVKANKMVGNFIGFNDIDGSKLPSDGSKRIWMMIVKVKEPNNCYNKAYVGDTGADNEKRFTGRTMYRYYRCMPIYTSNSDWNNTIGKY